MPGLSAQPPCYWNVSSLAGSGSAGWVDGQGAAAKLNVPHGVSIDPSTLTLCVAEFNGHRVRRITLAGLVTTLAGSGVSGFADGLGAAAKFSSPHGASVDSLGAVYVADTVNSRIRVVSPSGLVSTLAGSALGGSNNGVGTTAQFSGPTGIALASDGSTAYIAEQSGCRIRAIDLSTGLVSTLAGSGTCSSADGSGTDAQLEWPSSVVWHPDGMLYMGSDVTRVIRVEIASAFVSTLAGNGTVGGANGVGTLATFSRPRGVALDASGRVLYVSEDDGNRIREVNLATGLVKTIAGSVGGASGYANGFGTAALLNSPFFLAVSPAGVIFAADYTNHRIRQLTCVPCPASYFCSSGAPLNCPAGHFCPSFSVDATPCPAGTASAAAGAASDATCVQCSPGTFAGAGAANCTLCAPGSHAPAPGTTACEPCPGGHYCPLGTGSTAHLACGTGNYCPDGSAAPRPCPLQLPPAGGWGAQLAQGPAFVVETAHCLNHCFFNFSAGADGLLSKC